MNSSNKKLSLSLKEVEQITHACLVSNGCNNENATALTTTITAAERDGCPGHGLLRLPGYVAALRSGKVDGGAAPTIEKITPSMLRVDSHNGFAPLPLSLGRKPLTNAAREQGIALMGLVRVHHFSALWFEVEQLALSELCAIGCTAYMPSMPPAGGALPFFGTNPLAFGWPRKSGPPMVFDMASAAMARGELMVAARDRQEVPIGVGLDAEGVPTSNPQTILDEGVILPFGGYKGANIAMMVELLAAGLLDERFSFEAGEHDNKDGGPPQGGELLIVIDPKRLGGDKWVDHTEAFFSKMLSIEGTRLPSTRRYDNRAKSLVEGIEVPSDLHTKILSLTAETN